MSNIHKVKRAWENYKIDGEVKILSEILSEGTWNAPQTVKQARELAQIMAIPLPVSIAGDTIYDIVGDDGLFDDFIESEKKDGPDTDARYLIAYKLNEWLSDLGTEQDPGWRDPWNKQAIKIVRNAIAKFV